MTIRLTSRQRHMTAMNTFLMRKQFSRFGHVRRRDDDNIATSAPPTQIEGSRSRGRPKLRWMGGLKQDMKENQINVHPELASYRETTGI